MLGRLLNKKTYEEKLSNIITENKEHLISIDIRKLNMDEITHICEILKQNTSIQTILVTEKENSNELWHFKNNIEEMLIFNHSIRRLDRMIKESHACFNILPYEPQIQDLCIMNITYNDNIIINSELSLIKAKQLIHNKKLEKINIGFIGIEASKIMSFILSHQINALLLEDVNLSLNEDLLETIIEMELENISCVNCNLGENNSKKLNSSFANIMINETNQEISNHINDQNINQTLAL